jgi:Fe-S cluster biosynthesis and repair protein YggX
MATSCAAHIEARAKKLKLKRLFVLTTRTAHWFIERGFVETDVDALPAARRELYNLQRRSKVLVKALVAPLASQGKLHALRCLLRKETPWHAWSIASSSGREAEGLDLPPMPGEMGKKLWENVSKEAWQQWIKLQTMIINENRLSLADPSTGSTWPSRCTKHFFGEGADQISGYVPPASTQ